MRWPAYKYDVKGGLTNGHAGEADGGSLRRDAGAGYRCAALVHALSVPKPGRQRGLHPGGIRPDEPGGLSGEEERGAGQGPSLYHLSRGLCRDREDLHAAAPDEPLHQGLPAVPAGRPEPGLRGEEAVQGQCRRGPGLHQVSARDHRRQPARAHHAGDLRVSLGQAGQLHQGHGDVHPPAPVADAHRHLHTAPPGLLRQGALRPDQGRSQLRLGVSD